MVVNGIPSWQATEDFVCLVLLVQTEAFGMVDHNILVIRL